MIKVPIYWQIKPQIKFRFENIITGKGHKLSDILFWPHGKHSLSVKTHFLRRKLSIIFTVDYFLEVILSIYRFKKDCFPFKDGIKKILMMAGGTYFEYFTAQEQRTKITPLGVTGFTQVLIQLQLI